MADPQRPSGDARHEISDAELRPIALFLAALGVVVALSFGAMSLTFGVLDSLRESAVGKPTQEFDQRQLPPSPRLQAVPAADLERLRREEAEALSGYQWVDREAGRVRIPIGRAMELLLEQGLPTREQPADGGTNR